jgi:hypothetical protein
MALKAIEHPYKHRTYTYFDTYSRAYSYTYAYTYSGVRHFILRAAL